MIHLFSEFSTFLLNNFNMGGNVLRIKDKYFNDQQRKINDDICLNTASYLKRFTLLIDKAFNTKYSKISWMVKCLKLSKIDLLNVLHLFPHDVFRISGFEFPSLHFKLALKFEFLHCTQQGI